MSDDSANSLSESEYYKTDSLMFYNDDFTEEVGSVSQDKTDPPKSDIEDPCSSIKEDFKRVHSNEGESYEGSSNVLNKVDFDVDKTDPHKSDIEDPCSTIKEDFKRVHSNEGESYEGSSNVLYRVDFDGDAVCIRTLEADWQDSINEYQSDQMTDKTSLDATDFSEETIKKETSEEKEKFKPKTLHKLRRLLLDESHASGDQEYYVGDLLHVVESELMKLPKEKKKVSKKLEGNEAQESQVINPKKTKRKKSRILTRYAIRSLGLKRDYHMRNMEVIASSLSKELIQIDEIIEHFRQVNADFEAEFNQPNTPLGEANLASQRMDELFLKFKEAIPVLQDSYKEVKHCLGLYVKSDKTLGDDLLRNIKRYFGKSRVRNIPTVQHEEILEAFQNFNRQHCNF